MFSRTSVQSSLDLEIDRAVRSLSNHEVGSQEYLKVINSLSNLYQMREERDSVSKDTLAVIGGNLLGILMIIKHEHVNVITSKALNFVMKPR